MTAAGPDAGAGAATLAHATVVDATVVDATVVERDRGRRDHHEAVVSPSDPTRPRVVALGEGTSETGLLSTTNVAGANRAHVLQTLADRGPLSRADLARLAGVSRASIGGIVSGLLDEGILREQPGGPSPGRAGKPSRPLWFGDAGSYGAITVQPQGIDVAVVSAQGHVGERRQFPLPDVERLPVVAGPSGFDRQALADIRSVLEPHAGELRSIGLAVPAVFDGGGDLVASTTVPSLVGSRLPGLLAETFGVSVVLEDDARALALGQRWFGQARGASAFAALQVGEGIGAGIMLAGRLHRGAHTVSEIGHTTVDLRGDRCRCGLTGCWETIASLRWLRSRAVERGLPDGATMTPRRLAELCDDGNGGATELIDEYADHVSVGIVNLLHTLGVSLFILHGAVIGAGEAFLGRLRAHVHERTMSAVRAEPTVIFADDEESSGVLGAAAAAVTFSLGVQL